jgi:ribonuclease HII
MKRVLVAGVDEAGRGPLAGPVVCAAVILDPQHTIPGLGDSKALRESVRERLFAQIQREAMAWHVEFVEAEEVDRLNIFQATLAGMARAVGKLHPAPSQALIDGTHVPPGLPCRAEALIKGDAREPAIMAASILAKVSRDRHMRQLHARYPAYGFERHKGYPTPDHLEALRRFGPCVEHRKSFAPVRQALASDLLAPPG